MFDRFGRCAALAVFLLSASSVFAAVDLSPSPPDVEARRLQRPSDNIATLGADLFGEQVDLHSGATTFAVTDIDLPSHAGPAVRLQRRLRIEGADGFGPLQPIGPANVAAGLLTGSRPEWELDLPHMVGIYGSNAGTEGWIADSATPQARCSSGSGAPAAITISAGSASHMFMPHEFWSGVRIHIPGLGSRDLLRATPQTQNRSSTPSRWTTKDHWLFECLPSLSGGGSGEGFVAISPEGTRYYFDRMMVRGSGNRFTRLVAEVAAYETGGWGCLISNDFGRLAAQLVAEQDGGGSVGTGGGCGSNSVKAILYRSAYYLAVTRIEDRFGNFTSYQYDPDGKLSQVSASDGRAITLSYDANRRLINAQATGRHWSYYYDANGSLNRVVQPDGRAWSYQSVGTVRTSFLEAADPEPSGTVCGPPEQSFLGSEVDYTFSVSHPSGAQGEFRFAPLTRTNPWVLPCQSLLVTSTQNALVSKRITGPALAPAEWLYSYSAPNLQEQATCVAPSCPDTVSTQVTAPDGVATTYTFAQRELPSMGQLKAVTTHQGETPLRSESYDYVAPTATGLLFPVVVGHSLNPNVAETTAYELPQTRRVIEQDGVTHTWQANAFDGFARAVDISRSSSLGHAKHELLTYEDDRSRWVLGQLAVAADVGTGAIELQRSFDPASRLPTSQRQFGELLGSYAWNADGSLHTATDPRGNVTTFSDYYRGIPRRIAYADGSVETGTVNEAGWITGMTDARGNTTTFGYDPMGRLKTLTPPSGDSVAWAGTDIAFGPLASAAYGLPQGAWMQTISRGNYRKETYFDGLWRPVVMREYDSSDVAGTQRYTRRAYDALGRETFASWPAAGDVVAQGVRTQYDGLGRVVRSEQDGEHGPLVSLTEYLPGGAVRSTNPRGFVTTTQFQQFDEPSQERPLRIDAPEGQWTQITRDVFGKTLSLTRGGPDGASASRVYAYDGGQRLCQRTEPESGTTVFAYDAAGNLGWSAQGQVVADPAVCARDGVPVAARILRSYDALNRLTLVDVPGSSFDPATSYLPGGLVGTVANGPVLWQYEYNKLGLLTKETLNIDGRVKAIEHGYDALGYEASLKYPSGQIVPFAPNALGQAAQAGSYATGARYRVGGLLAGFSYGNGVLHSAQPNLRGLPASRRDAKGSVLVQDEALGYDGNGNPVCLRDSTAGRAGDRDLAYDALDRLVAAYAPNQAWISAGYGYDSLDNLRSARQGTRNYLYAYDNAQRLSRISTPGPAPTPQATQPLQPCETAPLLADIGGSSGAGGAIDPNPGNPGNTGGTTNPGGSTGGGSTGGGGNPGGGGNDDPCIDDNAPGCGGDVEQFRVASTNESLPEDSAQAGGIQRANLHARAGNGSLNGLEAAHAAAASSGSGDTTVYSLSHDAAGRMTQRGSQTYVFDAANRLEEVSTRERYQYDGHGRRVRIQRVSDGKYSYPIYSLSGQLLVEDDRRANTLTEYIPLNGRLVAKRVQPLNALGNPTGTASVRYLHTDLLGSPVAETDAAGNISRIERYMPYGEASDGVMDGGAGFTGHASDVATGLVYAQQRYYDPAIGRFLSVDPVPANPENGVNFNRYKYALNNPYRYTDPDGRCESISTCQMMRDDIDLIEGRMAREEHADRINARGAGALVGVGIVATAYTGGRAAPVFGAAIKQFFTKIFASKVVLTRAQQQATKKIDNIISNNAKPHDFAGVRNELKGVETGFDHVTEMRNSVTGLKDAVKSLEGSLNNPNLTTGQRTAIEGAVKRATETIEKMKGALSGK